MDAIAANPRVIRRKTFLRRGYSDPGPIGRIRYVVGKSIRKEERLREEDAFIQGPGGRYWHRERGVLHPVANVFQLLQEKSPGP